MSTKSSIVYYKDDDLFIHIYHEFTRDTYCIELYTYGNKNEYTEDSIISKKALQELLEQLKDFFKKEKV